MALIILIGNAKIFNLITEFWPYSDACISIPNNLHRCCHWFKSPYDILCTKNYNSIALKVIKSVLGPKYINHGRVLDPMLKLSTTCTKQFVPGLHFNFESSISLAANSALFWRLWLKLRILELRQVMLYICLQHSSFI